MHRNALKSEIEKNEEDITTSSVNKYYVYKGR